MEKTSFSSDIAGHRLQIWHAGPEKGTPLVYLHGAGGCRWGEFLTRLADKRPLWVPEHPGFGDSDLPPWLHSVRDIALYYVQWMDQQGLSTIDLAGSSFGGWVAAELAVLVPERIRRLVLTDAVGVTPPVPEAPDFFMIPVENMTERLYYRPPASVATQDPQVAVRNRQTVARFAWSPRFYNPDLEHWLFRIQCPTLLVWGAEDPLIPPVMAEPYMRGIANARLSLIAEAGHVPQEEQPDRFVELVEAHLEA